MSDSELEDALENLSLVVEPGTPQPKSAGTLPLSPFRSPGRAGRSPTRPLPADKALTGGAVPSLAFDSSSNVALKKELVEIKREFIGVDVEVPLGPSPKEPSDISIELQDADKSVEIKEEQKELTPRIEEFLKLARDHGLQHSRASTKVLISASAHLHRYTRPWASKRELSTIVERPERLLACYMGLGAAYMVAPLEIVEVMRRSSLTAPHVVKVHGKEWIDELIKLVSEVDLKHAANELEVPDTWPSGDIYLCSDTVKALEGVIGAIENGVDLIFEAPRNRAFVTIRPPGHHCHEDAASGFCMLNNAHIAIQYAKSHHQISHALIFDFDLHHGDGSQDLVWKLGFNSTGDADLPMAYYSLHDINSYPTERGYADPALLSAASVCLDGHGVSIWNVHLEPFATEEEFDELYESKYAVLFHRALDFLLKAEKESLANDKPFRPLIVISAGFDGSEFETPGMQRHKVHLPTSFYNRFTRDCGALADRFAAGRLLSLLEGGYSTPAISTGVLSHLTGLANVPFKPSWARNEVAKEFELGAKPRWKPSGQAGAGIQLGRALFPKKAPEQHERIIYTRSLRSRTVETQL
ncbi:Histone deacetylase HOS3 [Wickerhamiella sorbophila]|uniref:Histone deacetylase HOS3 n=1 Tax=Wickerhamiella sorbophila TaxID=45607 RepID=A0A2T0FMZ5_9ASCO|nr:Histone deacetylase HOS3 [Wickerhamiella sorbophila]PRT56373.1 Histone deacetylase HOS3 [Wickerhamiella sorbophila]